MVTKRTSAALVGTVCAGVLMATALGQAQQGPSGAPNATNSALFTAIDADNDGGVTRAEMKAAFGRWYDAADATRTGRVTMEQLGPSLNTTLGLQPPAPAAAPGGAGAGRAAGAAAPAAPQPGACGGRANLPTVGETPCANDVANMLAALPAAAPAKPARARKVLVLGNARGFVHSSIPMAARTIEELGKKTGAWTTTISYDPADINAKNLEQYDLLFLSNTTGCFLDGKTAQAAASREEVEARKAALIAFVRGGKGLAGTHAASDSYRGVCANDQPAAGAARGGGGGGGRGGNAASAGGTLANVFLRWSWGLNDQKLQANDQTLTTAEMEAVGDRIYTELDPGQAGRVTREDFATRIVPFVTQTNTYMGSAGRDQGRGSWPEFNTMIGGFFKFHWLDPHETPVKVDDKTSPLTKMFGGQDFWVNDEIYTYSVNSFSRKNVRVLTSINYDKMSFLAKLKESNPRPDHDYGLSWIKRDGQGRVFFMALGHNERIFGMKPMLEHLLAGMQYALGDLKADDAPSQK